MVRYYTSAGDVIDAGVVPTVPEEEFIITLDDWMNASSEDIAWLHDVPLHTNQEARLSEQMFSGDVKVRIRYKTPCITSLGRAA
ncbi:hypothetical protein SEA_WILLIAMSTRONG_53 [Microbacterium phage WilliamStrong]|nr:hypothetical protein SEA_WILLIAMSTRONG_53 [Microbacterium phage WilliamStrong]